uniref:KRAB-A domain-containing protein 2 n=1 Tax=Cacopsylla melanoneura TaxID=428564 RepID=A0A8D8SPJ0_9HEMI
MNDVIKAKTVEKKQPRDYRLLKHYDVMQVGGKSKLIYPLKDGETVIKYYVTDSELFQILHDIHLAIGHKGRDRMSKVVGLKYKNITRQEINLYLRLCELCQRNQKGKKGKILYFSSSLPQDVLKNIQTKEELEEIISRVEHSEVKEEVESVQEAME